MNFESGGIYHIYNQGNNRQAIFHNRENYFYFLRKIRFHILPFADILAYCLMPNHFHLMVEVKDVSIIRASALGEGFTKSETLTQKPSIITLNDSIGVLLRSYTRAINIQESRSGSLFRKETKAICLNEIKGISSNWYLSSGIAFLNVQISESQYPQVCFNYIHSNPVKSGLVNKPEDWEFSSCKDLKGLRNEYIVNRDRAEKLGLVV